MSVESINLEGLPNIPPQIRFDDLPWLIQPTAKYQNSPQAMAILRKGIIDEVEEILKSDLKVGEEKAKEVADVVWYIVAIAQENQLNLADIVGYDTVDGFQDDKLLSPRLPINTIPPEGILPDEELAFRALRVVDILNPASDELWQGFSERPELSAALYDLLVVLARQYAEQSDGSKQLIRLNEALRSKLAELYKRSRDNHNVKAAEHEMNMRSLRGRLLSPLGKLTRRATVQQVLQPDAETAPQTE
jgi:hypothetical protein